MLLIIPRRCLNRFASQLKRHEIRSKLMLHTSCVRYNEKSQKGVSKKSSADEAVSVFERLRKEEPKAVTTTQKVVENAKTSVNLVIIAGGFIIIIYLLYSVLSEFVSKASPTSIFNMAMKKIENDDRAIAVLGEKIKGYGDPHSRTNKRLEHQPYEVAGVDYLRVIFHVVGNRRQGVVHCDLKKSKKGWRTRYIVITLDGFPPGRISIEDNRLEVDSEDLPDIDYSGLGMEAEE